MASHKSTDLGETSGKNWLGALMFGLLYPAVLGTFFYSLLPETLEVVRHPTQLNTLRAIKLLLAYLLIGHFLVDFHYTQQVALETRNYPRKIFFIDLAIVLALFVAYETVHLDDQCVKPEVRWIAGAMFIAYILFRVWERSMRKVIGKSCGLILYETGVALLFLLIVVWPNVYILAGTLVLSAVLMYSIGGPIVDQFHQRPVDERVL